jgi:amidase
VELHRLTALQQSEGLRRGDFTCVELTDHHLRRTEALDARVGAFITVTADDALRQARRVDERIRVGDAPAGPLLGCTAPVKDLDFVAGVRCTFGSEVFATLTAPADSDFVRRLRAAGLIITGKTNTPEFGLPCYTENRIAPAARTPWDLSRSAGGSSGGAAAAVATGLAAVAPGSDGGGSIRIPASVTGLVGIKPSRGRIGPGPGVDEVGELGVLGPLGRTVADAAALLDVMAGTSPGDTFALPPGPSFLDAARRDPPRLRIGRYSQPVIVDTDVAPECLAAYGEATALLLRLGHEVVDVPRPYGPEAVDAFETVWAAGVAAIPLPAGSEERIMPLTGWLLERGRGHSAADTFRAVRTMRLLSRSAIEAGQQFDAILTPALAQPPAAVGGLRDELDPAADFAAQKAFTPFTSPYNVSGQPALSFPMSWTAAGLPIGVQLVARPRDEYTIISLAAQMERAADGRPTHDLW